MRLRLGRPDLGRYHELFDLPVADSGSPMTLTWLGVSPSRLSKVGHGSSQPVSAGTSEIERQANRRVEVIATRR